MLIKFLTVYALIFLGVLSIFAANAQGPAPFTGPIGNSQRITLGEFNEAVTLNGFPKPSPDIHEEFIQATLQYSRPELAMFLAQMIYQSGGFRFREDVLCTTGNHCSGNYVDNVGLPGKNYYGRGFLKIAWGKNYAAASRDLGLGDLLLKNPELVATNTRYAVLTSLWYWNTQVRPKFVRNQNFFGTSTKAINGDKACQPNDHQEADSRYGVYTKVATVLKIEDKALPNGCYN